MRLSTDQSDSGYHPQAAVIDVRVSLNGVYLSTVITADEEAGTVLAYVLDEEGCLKDAPELLHGVVRIEGFAQ